MNLTNKIIILSFFLFFLFNGLTFLNIIPEKFVTDNFFYSLSNVLAGNVYVIITALFMHGSFTHLISNAMMLYIVGNALEEIGGSKKFAIVFFCGGAASFILSSPSYAVNDLLVGNSGAIFTVMAVVALVNPLSYKKSRVYKIVFGSGSEIVSQVSKEVFDKKNFLLNVFIFIMIQFTAIMLYTTIVSDESVGHLGHFVGFLIGVVFGIAWSEKLQGIVRGTGKNVLIMFFLVLFLAYGSYILFHIVNPTSNNFIDDFLSSFNINLFSSETVKCNNYCLDNNYDYGVVDEGICSCMINQSFEENLG
ncbi:MAG: rhomboid family intramembrane serine protease [Nanoarchaeota archaeon]|nr:rhomboid family intramembrane serine protease [Nanoarchaeota archaeon]